MIDWTSIGSDAAATMSRYVQFDTTNPPGNELAAAHWLAEQIRSRNVADDVTVHEPIDGRGLVLAHVPGSDPSLRPLLINHHLDVVAADPTKWTHPPFSGAISDGFVWGRGTLDTKDLGVIFLLALQSLRSEGVKFRRPLVFLAVPDEETGGVHGMQWFVERYGASLNPEWVWDEGSGGLKGMFGPGVMFGVAVAEKQIQQLRLTATGKPGHASMPHGDNANVHLLSALDRLLKKPRPIRLNAVTAELFRVLASVQRAPAGTLLRHLDNPLIQMLAGGRIASDPTLNALVRDTLSLTVLKSGYKTNVIPERAEAEVDCRLLPDTDAAEFRAWVKKRLANDHIAVEITESSLPSGIAPTDSPFYRAVETAVTAHVPDARTFPLQMPGATDGRYWRSRGFAAYGFGPVLLTRDDLTRVHGIDERISIDNLVLGIKITRDVIRKLCVT